MKIKMKEFCILISILLAVLIAFFGFSIPTMKALDIDGLGLILLSFGSIIAIFQIVLLISSFELKIKELEPQDPKEIKEYFRIAYAKKGFIDLYDSQIKIKDKWVSFYTSAIGKTFKSPENWSKYRSIAEDSIEYYRLAKGLKKNEISIETNKEPIILI
jgi:hypothetical protein